RKLRRITTLISDGRYSGVTYGAAIGHMTPEAYEGGGILYLKTGDFLYLNLLENEIQFLDKESLYNGHIKFDFTKIKEARALLGKERMETMKKRQRLIAPSNLLINHT